MSGKAIIMGVGRTYHCVGVYVLYMARRATQSLVSTQNVLISSVSNIFYGVDRNISFGFSVNSYQVQLCQCCGIVFLLSVCLDLALE